MTNPLIIGLVGAAGCGKDTVADALITRGLAFKHSSGDPIKEVFARHYAYGQTPEWADWACYTHEGKDALHPYLMGYNNPERAAVGERRMSLYSETYPGAEPEPLTNREVLEFLGDAMNMVDPLVLMRPMPELAREARKILVDTSTREPAQAEFVRSHEGIIVYVSRPEAEAKAGAHQTARFYEWCLQEGVIDYTIDNSQGLAELDNEIERLCEHYSF
jgi:hypothetical protein